MATTQADRQRGVSSKTSIAGCGHCKTEVGSYRERTGDLPGAPMSVSRRPPNVRNWRRARSSPRFWPRGVRGPSVFDRILVDAASQEGDLPWISKRRTNYPIRPGTSAPHRTETTSEAKAHLGVADAASARRANSRSRHVQSSNRQQAARLRSRSHSGRRCRPRRHCSPPNRDRSTEDRAAGTIRTDGLSPGSACRLA